ncbi:Do family serine endopeptidase [Arsenicitalea aurantiaca]|uniref:Probable periplasmic serine endoprotease DegP-like n=1 Tax=Arsenicitalea aurantiaca TaxID=1783274 RepID=A0A433XA67_9HYPH|nr:Do family serine endopeptidase [Arsenicitalea aurantiaca]RUT30976.1 Do family serine endopeptidase [Arsenicitalea aurantiaca]
MRSTFLSRARRWIGASALAILAGVGGGATFMATTSQIATAQTQINAPQFTPAAQIQVPQIAEPASFADLVEAVQPAVVSIVVESEQRAPSLQRRGGGGGGGGGFNFDFPDLPENHPFRDFFDRFNDGFGNRGNEPQQRTPRRFMAAGSGFAISADGYFVTNNHVVSDATRVTVVFENGDERVAEIVGTDERTDLAVLKVDGVEDLPFVTFASDETRVGDWVMAVGNPFGLGGTVTVGIVSARGRDIGGSSYGDFLQIDAAVNTGNSGGPTFNLRGEVVGVNTAIYSPNGGNVGIAFAIPANTVQQIVGQLIENGEVTRGFLGVSIQDVNTDLANSLGLPNARGALVTEPAEGGPAERAGINSGDVITAVDGQQISNALDLSRTIASKGPNTEVELTLWRNGREDTLRVTLDTLEETAAPTPPAEVEEPAQPDEPTPSSIGVTVVPNADDEGVLIQDVDAASIAASRGLAVGDVILEVDNTPVSTAAEFEAAIQGVRDSDRGTVLIKTSRNDNIRFIGLPLEESAQ